MLVAHGDLHYVEDLINRAELDLVVLLEVLAHQKLPQRVNRPDVFICWVKLYEVGVRKELHSKFFL
jgi:hypothetical protein